MELEIPDAAAMEQLGARIAAHCPPGARIFLQGALGTGKTTFVRGFLRGLGYDGFVKSPTFTLIEPYRVTGRDIYHIDLYRMQEAAELESIGLRDYFDQEGICLVEWPEKGGAALGRPDLHITLSFLEGSGRCAVLEGQSLVGQAILEVMSEW